MSNRIAFLERRISTLRKQKNRYKKRIAELEAVLQNARLAMLDVDTVNPAIAQSYRQIVETLEPLGYEFEKIWDENIDSAVSDLTEDVGRFNAQLHRIATDWKDG